MNRTKTALGALGACAVMALGAALGGASTPAAEAAPAAADGMIAAMQRDLGLSEAEAVTRLHQESAALRIDPAAREAAGDDYGGSWFDPRRGTLVVGLTSEERSAAVERTGAETTLVEHTQAELNATKSVLDGYAARGAVPDGVASWHVDPRSGSVAVAVREGATGVAAFLDRAREAGPVTVTEIEGQPRTFAAGTVGGDPYYINGNTRCSIGFSVRGGFVTAGHCGGAGASVSGWDGSPMGSFAGSSFPGNDYAFVRIGNGWWTEPVVLGWGTVPDRLVRGSAEAPVGSSICRSGSTTHWHCGTVLAKNETVNYEQGAVYQMTKTSVCAEPGDSGGSFITGDQAQGVTSGGWGNCGSGGETWFQPVNEILDVYGLSLVTS
ncbi:alpha-lytic protease prodomain-containing protein [Prauserella shujinwangii]|uniref:Alpha-lytic protease prodomain-containing protein n=1 Tax=Prauserella shujinwangii TaxID=1453103 RepID=A0A2T0M3X7_9PSEU|nr:S1 family peptidase [Prauserella shujinwangii]PRX51412.1 alpha-lytic protease prodomain-containing protein [Prauserella shujinwangii]